MTFANRSAFALALALFALSLTARAQTPRLSTANVRAEPDRVRVSAEGDVYEMRVDVADESGEIVFQSGQVAGQALDWDMKDSAGARVPPGSYLVTVTYRASSGKLRKRVEQVEVTEEVTGGAAARTQAAPNPQPNIAGTGATGKIAKWTNSTGTLGNSIITESAAKIGVNVAAPVSKLHVVSASADKPPRLQSTGNTSFAAGWDFYHGTTGKGYVGVPGTGATIGPGELILYGGAGTKTSLWAGGNRAVTILADGRMLVGTQEQYGAKVVGYTDDTKTGVYGESKAGSGVLGFSITGSGVFGQSNSTTGASSDAGIHGENTSGGWAGYFKGPVAVVGGCQGCTTAPSDRALKANIAAVNPRSVLDKLAAVPIQSWSYKSDLPSVRHVGPMAQDFRSAFQLGADDKHIDMIDANGVTMAAVQALYQLMQEKDRQIARQNRRIERLQAQLGQVRRDFRHRRAAKR